MSDVEAPPRRAGIEDDEAMARRLQEEFYGSGGAQPEVRAPIARQTETLVGPDANWGPGDDNLEAMVAEQLANRRRVGGKHFHGRWAGRR
jgi:hypothetical protein